MGSLVSCLPPVAHDERLLQTPLEAASNMADRATLTRLGDSPSVMEKGSQELEDSLAVERKKVRPSPAIHS